MQVGISCLPRDSSHSGFSRQYVPGHARDFLLRERLPVNAGAPIGHAGGQPWRLRQTRATAHGGRASLPWSRWRSRRRPVEEERPRATISFLSGEEVGGRAQREAPITPSERGVGLGRAVDTVATKCPEETWPVLFNWFCNTQIVLKLYIL